MSTSEPDFDKLQEINDEFEQLADDGKLTQQEFDRLLEDARKAVGKHTEFLEGLLMRGTEHGFVK